MKVRIGDLTKIRTGKLDANAASMDGQYPFFTCSKEPLRISTYSYDCECVLVAGNGDLNVKYYNGKFDAYQRTYIIENNNIEKLYLPYLYYFLETYIEELRKQAIGGVIKYIKICNLRDAVIELPSIEKQKKIVKILKSSKKCLDMRNTQMAVLDGLIKARFVEMFGDVKYGSERWGGKPFKDITINLDSKRKPVKDADRKSMQGIYPYYGATGIVDYINDYRQDGDFLLISEDGKALELRSKPIAFLASGKIWVNNHAHVQQCTDECNMIYLMYHINFMDISIWVTGIDQKKLNRANLDTIPIALPPIELQEQFADFVHQVDKSKLLSLIKLLEQLITYLYNVFIIYRQDKGEEVEDHE
mgnify:FL=1